MNKKQRDALIDSMQSNDQRENYLLSYGNGRGKTFVVLYPDNAEVWVDLKCLPQTCFLCACCDGVNIMQVKCSKNIQRHFLPMEWLLNKWGASKEFTDPLQKLQEKMNKEAKKIRDEKNEGSS